MDLVKMISGKVSDMVAMGILPGKENKGKSYKTELT